ncbi:MAG: LacI family DNA-binding transcriptional regulator [Desulfobacterales bacterium]|nr:MAG: LacI family DNA-binding transcriptional regulator [Desulfobacterales bacterium]
MAQLTMAEISKMAGVSLATVSRTIHSPHLVRKSTRERVIHAMEKVNYVYHAAAADLSRKRSSIIGVIIPTAKSLVFSTTLQAIQEAAQQNNYSLVTGSSKYDMVTELRLLQQFKERRVAGIILTGFVFGQKDVIKELVKGGMACVVIWDKLDDPDLSYVGFDNFKATYKITEYLISLKHRRIGLIVGPYTKVERVKKRLEGFKTALKDYGLPYDPALVIEKEPTLVDGKEAMSRLLTAPERPTAVLAASDTLAVGALTAARDMRLRVPEDISLAGFDDIEVAAYCNPPLTTVNVPAYEIGQIAFKILMNMINSKSRQVEQYCLDTSIIVRGSCREL